MRSPACRGIVVWSPADAVTFLMAGAAQRTAFMRKTFPGAG